MKASCSRCRSCWCCADCRCLRHIAQQLRHLAGRSWGWHARRRRTVTYSHCRTRWCCAGYHHHRRILLSGQLRHWGQDQTWSFDTHPRTVATSSHCRTPGCRPRHHRRPNRPHHIARLQHYSRHHRRRSATYSWSHTMMCHRRLRYCPRHLRHIPRSIAAARCRLRKTRARRICYSRRDQLCCCRRTARRGCC